MNTQQPTITVHLDATEAAKQIEQLHLLLEIAATQIAAITVALTNMTSDLEVK